MIIVEKTKLEQVLLIKPQAFEDHRGYYVETYNEELYRKNGIDVRFVQDDYSASHKHVLRGIHGDSKTFKLISCPYGRLYLVVINLLPQSPQYRQWEAFVLSDHNRHQVLVPPGFGNGHLVLSDWALFQYKQSTYYDPTSQFSYRWNDPELGIWWPVSNPVVSRRDEMGRYET